MPPVGAAIAAAMPYIIGGAAVAGVVQSVSAASDAKKAASNASQDQANRQAKLEGDVAARAANEESEANAIATRNTAKQRQRARAVGAGGRQDTILTGPSGGVGEAAGGLKTLLGA